MAPGSHTKRAYMPSQCFAWLCLPSDPLITRPVYSSSSGVGSSIIILLHRKISRSLSPTITLVLSTAICCLLEVYNVYKCVCVCVFDSLSVREWCRISFCRRGVVNLQFVGPLPWISAWKLICVEPWKLCCLVHQVSDSSDSSLVTNSKVRSEVKVTRSLHKGGVMSFWQSLMLIVLLVGQYEIGYFCL